MPCLNSWSRQTAELDQYFVVQSLSYVQPFVNPWTATCQASVCFTISRSLLKLMSTESMMPSNQLIICHPLYLPSHFPSIMVFANESALHIGWPKYWHFSFIKSPFNEYSGLIFFWIDWFDLLAVRCLLQHHKSKSLILWCSAFFVHKHLVRLLIA